jgi:hypothetical protein
MAFNIPPSKKTKRVVAASGGLRPYAHPAFPDKPLSRPGRRIVRTLYGQPRYLIRQVVKSAKVSARSEQTTLSGRTICLVRPEFRTIRKVLVGQSRSGPARRAICLVGQSF